MFPDIKIFDKVISWYSVMALIGIFFCGWYVLRICKRKKIDDNEIIISLLISSIGVIVGSHLLYAITKMDLIVEFIKNISKISSFKVIFNYLIQIFGGSVFYGGLIGGLIAFNIYAKRKKIDKNLFSDLLTPIIPLFHTFGRIGCFLSGCCFGVRSKVGFMYKHSAIEVANNVNRFPIQLVEATYNLILFLILNYFYKKKKFKGKLIYIYLILYPVGRFIFEFFRGDTYRGFLFGLSTSQIISLILLVYSLFMLIIKRNKK